MNSVDVLLALCKQRRIAVSRVERDLKYGNGYFKSLKKKEIPGNRLSEVADYFHVTMDYLLGATPESYLLGTEYQLEEAERAYAKETDPDKRDELGGLIDLLKDSLEDQRLALRMKKPPATEDGNGRYGLTKAQWKQIGSLFRTKLLSMPKAPAWLATAQTGLSEEEVGAFFAGEHFVTKAQIHAMADRMSMDLWDIIGAYARAFDGEEDEVIAARDWLRRAAAQLSPELVKQAVLYLDVPKEDEQSAADDLALLRHVRHKRE